MVLLLIPVTAALVAFVNWLGLRPFHRAAALHWTERARLIWPARQTARLQLWLMPSCVILGLRTWSPSTASGFEWPIFVACVSGAFLGTYPFDCAVYPGFAWKNWLHEVAGWWSIRLSGIAALITAAWLMPAEWGWETVSWALAGAGYFIWLQWRGWLLLAELWKLASPAPAHIKAMVEAVAARCGAKVGQVWLLRSVTDGAFAMPLTGELLFTERAVQVHSHEELAAIAGHELGHLKESRGALAIRAASMFTITPWVFIKPVFASYGPLGILALFVAMLVCSKLILRFSRRMEFAADAAGSGSETDAGCYARALERLHELNLIPAVFPNDNLTHPHLYDRLVAIGHTPDYPRPAKPSSFAWPQVLLWICTAVLIGIWAVRGGG